MVLDARLMRLADQRWQVWREGMDQAGAVPVLVIATAPGVAPGTASYTFACAPEARAGLPQMLRRAAEEIERRQLAGGPVILTPAAGSAEGGGS